MIKLIVAVGPHNLIGHDDKMPWHVSEEFKYFKKMTMGHALLFGRKTFLGLPSKLPGRKHIVLSSHQVATADESVTSLDQLEKIFQKYKNSKEVLFIAGGKMIYEQFYQKADEIYVSEMEVEAHGNIFLKIDLSSYKKSEFQKHDQFTVYKYTK